MPIKDEIPCENLQMTHTVDGAYNLDNNELQVTSSMTTLNENVFLIISDL